MIEARCACGRILKAPDSLSGKRARCPACQSVVPLPEAAPSSTEQKAEPRDLDLDPERVPKAAQTTESAGGSVQPLRPPKPEARAPGLKLIPDSSPTDKEAPAPAEAPAGKSPRKRWFLRWDIWAAVLLVLLLLGALAVELAPDPVIDAFQYMPADCHFIGVVDTHRLADTPGMKDALRRVGRKPSAMTLAELGVSPKNIRCVHIGGRLPQSRWDVPTVLMIVQIEEPVVLDGVIKELKKLSPNAVVSTPEVEGRKVQRFITSWNNVLDMVHLNENLLLVGDAALVRECLQVFDGNRDSVRQRRHLMDVAEGAGKEDVFWLAYAPKKPTSEGEPDDPDKPELRVEENLLRARYDGEMIVTMEADCTDSGAAGKFRDDMNKVLAILAAETGFRNGDYTLEVKGRRVDMELILPKWLLRHMMRPRQPAPPITLF